jgi:hypothetical protein
VAYVKKGEMVFCAPTNELSDKLVVPAAQQARGCESPQHGMRPTLQATRWHAIHQHTCNERRSFRSALSAAWCVVRCSQGARSSARCSAGSSTLVRTLLRFSARPSPTRCGLRRLRWPALVPRCASRASRGATRAARRRSCRTSRSRCRAARAACSSAPTARERVPSPTIAPSPPREPAAHVHVHVR